MAPHRQTCLISSTDNPANYIPRAQRGPKHETHIGMLSLSKMIRVQPRIPMRTGATVPQGGQSPSLLPLNDITAHLLSQKRGSHCPDPPSPLISKSWWLYPRNTFLLDLSCPPFISTFSPSLHFHTTLTMLCSGLHISCRPFNWPPNHFP